MKVLCAGLNSKIPVLKPESGIHFLENYESYDRKSTILPDERLWLTSNLNYDLVFMSAGGRKSMREAAAERRTLNFT